MMTLQFYQREDDSNRFTAPVLAALHTERAWLLERDLLLLSFEV
jgi:hypothetical protein